MKNLSEFGLHIPLEEYSFTLFADSGTKKENFSGVEKLVLSFTNEADFSAWFDALQMKVKDVISVYHLQFSPYSLYQIYSVLAINHGISLLEKELIAYQPEVPPLPPGPEHYTVKDCTKMPKLPTERRDTVRERRNTTWIEDSFRQMEDGDDDDDFDLDLDSIVDAKLSQLSKGTTEGTKSPRKSTVSSPRESETKSPRRSMTSPASPRSQNKLSWIRSQDAIKPRGSRKALLSRKTLDPPNRSNVQ